MNNLNYPFRLSKNRPPSVFRKMIEKKINEETIEYNQVFCIDFRKAFAIKSTPRSVFRNPSQKNKIGIFSISVKFGFLFLYKNHDETDCVS